MLVITFKIKRIIDEVSVTALKNERNLNQKQNMQMAETNLIYKRISDERSVVLLTISEKAVSNNKGIRRISK